MKQAGRLCFGVCALATFLTACATPRTSMEIAVTADGAVAVENERIVMKRLPAELQSRGANRQTGIYITVPEHTSPALLREVTETLATAGYGRLIFTKPRQVSAASKAE